MTHLRFLALLVVVQALGCPSEELVVPEPEPPLPAPDALPSDQLGPYAVSATTIETADERGKWMVMEVWYPSAPAADAELQGYPGVNLVVDAFRDEPWDLRGAPYPLVAFSHGNGGIRFQSSFLCVWLASHGFVVVAPDHEHNTLLDLDPRLTVQVASERPRDITNSVDLVAEAMPDRLDLDAGYAVVGHSFGAWTSLVLGGGEVDLDELITHCSTTNETGCGFFDLSNIEALGDLSQAVPDPRVAVAVTLAPGFSYTFGADGSGLGGNVPTLVLGGDRDSDLSYEREIRPVYESLPESAALGTLANAAHFGFSDMCAAVPFFDECEGADAGFMEIERVHAITNTLSTAWIRARWRGEESEETFLSASSVTAEGDVAWDE